MARPRVGRMSCAGAVQARRRESGCAFAAEPAQRRGFRNLCPVVKGDPSHESFNPGRRGGAWVRRRLGPPQLSVGRSALAEKKLLALQRRCDGAGPLCSASRSYAWGRGSAGGGPGVGRVHAVRRTAAAPHGAVALAEGRDDDAVAVGGGVLGLDVGLHRQSAVSYRQRARSREGEASACVLCS